MKEPSGNWLERIRERVEAESPPWLLAPISSLYSWLHPCRKKFLALPLRNSWVLITSEFRVLLAKEKRVAPVHLSELYSEYCGGEFGVESGDIVLDVGAHAGLFTLPASKKAERVVAIEPCPLNLAYLKHNVSGLRNVTVVEKALWRRGGRMRLFFGLGSFEPSLRAGEKEQPFPSLRWCWVEAETLDGLVSELGLERVDFLKMDVEGAELDVLSGGKRTLGITRKVAVAAYHLRGGRQTWPEVERILRKHGFETQVTEKRIVRGWRPSNPSLELKGSNDIKNSSPKGLDGIRTRDKPQPQLYGLPA